MVQARGFNLFSQPHHIGYRILGTVSPIIAPIRIPLSVLSVSALKAYRLVTLTQLFETTNDASAAVRYFFCTSMSA